MNMIVLVQLTGRPLRTPTICRTMSAPFHSPVWPIGGVGDQVPYSYLNRVEGERRDNHQSSAPLYNGNYTQFSYNLVLYWGDGELLRYTREYTYLHGLAVVLLPGQVVGSLLLFNHSAQLGKVNDRSKLFLCLRSLRNFTPSVRDIV